MNIIQTFAQLQQVKAKESQRFTCVERANAEYVVQPSGYVALAGDVTFGNGLVGALTLKSKTNVLFFGAKYDGITDDTQAHQDCLERLDSNGGGVMLLGEGTTNANIDNTFANVGIEGLGRASVIAPTSGRCLSVRGIAGGFGSLIHNMTFSGENGADTGLYVRGFSRGKFGDLWTISGLDFGLDIDGDGSTEFTFENVYIHNPVLRGLRYLRTDGVDTGGVYFDTLHITGPAAGAKGMEVSSTHTSRSRAFIFINKLIIDNTTEECMLLENVESFFIAQAWMTGTAPSFGLLSLRDVKDCFINQAWIQNSSATGYALLFSGGAGSDETADFMVDQLRTSGPSTAIQFNGSPTITRCNIGQWDTTATTKTNDLVRLALFRSELLEGNLTISNKLNLGASFGTLTISAGAITPTSTCHRVAPETGTVDDLSTISGGAQGDFLVLMTNSSANTITIKNGTGNIYLASGADKVITSSRTKVLLVNFNSEWQEIG